VAILGDLQGPKLRIGEVENNQVELIEGNEVEFVTQECMGTANCLYLSYKEFPVDVKIGESILLDDGKLKLQVTKTNGKNSVTAKVIYGGILSSKKGVNLPDTKISIPSITEKDLADAEFMLDNNFDWIALSFVRSAEDLHMLKELIKKRGKQTGVIAKIEKPEAIKQIDKIIAEADAVMVARGDLGVEVPFDLVPYIQKQIVSRCITQSKPVIIATQMLESMIVNYRATRAEVNDVANAVYDGADTLMLSGETSVGKYPVEAIRTMQKVIESAENREFVLKHVHKPDCSSFNFLPESICYNAVEMANLTGAKAIITFTNTGVTAYKISSHRPKANIYAFTANHEIENKLALVWGVRVFYMPDIASINDAVTKTVTLLKQQGFLKKDEVVVYVGSIPMKDHGPTNMMKISYVP
jgi:pyruvate kinase